MHTVPFDKRVPYRGNYPYGTPHPRNFEPPLFKFQTLGVGVVIEIAHGKVVPSVHNRVTIPHGFVCEKNCA